MQQKVSKVGIHFIFIEPDLATVSESWDVRRRPPVLTSWKHGIVWWQLWRHSILIELTLAAVSKSWNLPRLVTSRKGWVTPLASAVDSGYPLFLIKPGF